MKRIDAGIKLALVAGVALTACNKGAFIPDKENITGTAEGVYSGALTDSPSGATDFAAIVLEDGTFWTLYGDADPTLFSVQGFARGSGASDAGDFISDQAVDFGFTPPEATTLEAEYDPDDSTIEGTYTTTAGTTGFAGGPIPGPYEYGATPDLALLNGTWDLLGTDGVTYTLDIDTDGNFDFMEQGSGGCTGTGVFAAHGSGKNLFAVTVMFDDVPECVLQDSSATGIALAYTVTGVDVIQLVAAVTDDQDTFGLALSGTVPAP